MVSVYLTMLDTTYVISSCLKTLYTDLIVSGLVETVHTQPAAEFRPAAREMSSGRLRPTREGLGHAGTDAGGGWHVSSGIPPQEDAHRGAVRGAANFFSSLTLLLSGWCSLAQRASSRISPRFSQL